MLIFLLQLHASTIYIIKLFVYLYIRCSWRNSRTKLAERNWWFSNLYIFEIQCRRSQIFQTMNSVRWKKSKFEISKVYTIRWTNIGIRKSEFVTRLISFWRKSMGTKEYGIEGRYDWRGPPNHMIIDALQTDIPFV